MYVIEKIEDLIGKEIAYFNPCYVSQNLVIGTADGGIFMMEQELFDDEVEFAQLKERYVMADLNHNKRLRDKMVEAGVIPERTAQEWEDERKRQEEKAKVEREAKRKEFELKQLKGYLDKYGVPAEYK